ncbi:MAG: NADH-quinone oxidoreductase subunit L [Pirellulales bacterium]
MLNDMRILMILIPGLPLAAAILIGLLGPKVLKGQSHWPALIGICGSFLLSLMLLGNVQSQTLESSSGGYEHIEKLWTWASIPDAWQPLDSQAGAASGRVPWQIDVTLRADPLTTIMLSMVTFIATLVVIYASGYMHGDRGYWRFFAYVSLFVFSMTMLVSVSNFMLLFVFWEAVGVCSYLLIGFWYEKESAAQAGMKAFLVNRVGDFGFAFAIFLIWIYYGTLDFHDSALGHGVLGEARLTAGSFVGGSVGLAIALLLMLGACGKSAQLPLHVWLPDAMEGPTPVSALIHAATMVTAGVYMVTRCTPLFIVSPEAQLTVSAIGGLTALMAGLIAVSQFDLKRVLAYSTVSQLGFMFLALGTGSLAGITAGMFHLFTHAFFKALLFLGSGSVMHAMGNVIDMRRFGGLRRLMPITHWTFLFGCLALAGVVPFAGFWSKDQIVAAVHSRAHGATHHDAHGASPNDSHPAPAHNSTSAGSSAAGTTEVSAAAIGPYAGYYVWLYRMSLLTAFLTAFYTFRAYYMTFFGPEVVPHEAHGHAHESPPTMWIPLTILAAFALVVGAFFEWTHGFSQFLLRTPSLAWGAVAATEQPGAFHWNIAAISTLVALLGIALASYFYLGPAREAELLKGFFDLSWLPEGRWGAPADRLLNAEWARNLAAALTRMGLGPVARILGGLVSVIVTVVWFPVASLRQLTPYRLSSGKFYIDEIYQALIVKPLKAVAQVAYVVDRWVVDGLVNLVGSIPGWGGRMLRGLQGGLVSFYGLAMVLALLSLVAVRIVWGG